jgi:hypothetical protein
MTARGMFLCAACQRQTSPIARTVLEGTRKPSRIWVSGNLVWDQAQDMFLGSHDNEGRFRGFQRSLTGPDGWLSYEPSETKG